ncbi:unnamed protein product [Effrenium voratum]|nr:unnamed protein product [Effrenium voratum]
METTAYEGGDLGYSLEDLKENIPRPVPKMSDEIDRSQMPFLKRDFQPKTPAERDFQATLYTRLEAGYNIAVKSAGLSEQHRAAYRQFRHALRFGRLHRSGPPLLHGLLEPDMTPEGIRLLLLHLTGFAGLALNVGISVSPWRAMRSNRDSGSLRGLDTRSWPLLMYSNLFWSGYATYHGDIWQFCATLPASLVWLFFIVSAIRLLGQEEGDLAKGLEGQGWNLDVLREFRQRRLWSLELESFGGLLVGFLIMVVLGPWEIPGLEVLQTTLKPDMKAEALGLICCIGTCLAYGNPVFR